MRRAIGLSGCVLAAVAGGCGLALLSGAETRGASPAEVVGGFALILAVPACALAGLALGVIGGAVAPAGRRSPAAVAAVAANGLILLAVGVRVLTMPEWR